MNVVKSQERTADNAAKIKSENTSLERYRQNNQFGPNYLALLGSTPDQCLCLRETNMSMRKLRKSQSKQPVTGPKKMEPAPIQIIGRNASHSTAKCSVLRESVDGWKATLSPSVSNRTVRSIFSHMYVANTYLAASSCLRLYRNRTPVPLKQEHYRNT